MTGHNRSHDGKATPATGPPGPKRCAASSVAFLLGLAVVTLASLGCGQAGVMGTTAGVTGGTATAGQKTSPSPASAPTSSSRMPVTTALAPPGMAATPSEIEEVFAHVAASLAPLIIFGPSQLPGDALLADRWLPVIDADQPVSSNAEGQENPFIVGEGVDAEVQVAFHVGAGRLLVLENFHGDLGDVNGTEIGSVAGNLARVYAVNGGELVQWSASDCWYGVFGRGVRRETVIAVALGMRPVAGPQDEPSG